MTSEILDVAILGAGASGTALAADLIRARPRAAVVLIDPNGFGRGLAYSTPFDLHLLNVPAAKMSALESDPEHFLDWLRSVGNGAEGGTFAPRKLYGAYLESLLADTHRRAERGLEVIRVAAVSLRRDADWIVGLSDGSQRVARTVVLALGNDIPAPVRVSGASLAERAGLLFSSPWVDGALDQTPGDVLLIGTGLTAVDAALALEQAGCGQIHALSRHGLIPHVHARGTPFLLSVPDKSTPRTLLQHLRREADRAASEGNNWRSVVDAFRPLTQTRWRSFSLEDRRRFLRHLRHFWDVHRHRMAPDIGARIARLRSEGRLQIHAGRLLDLAADDVQLRARFRVRGLPTVTELAVTRVINCTGPGPLAWSDSPLVKQLLADRLAEIDTLGMGFHVDPSGQLQTPSGSVPRLFAIGPLRRGECWESTAMPEIRMQAAALARVIWEIGT